MRTQHLSRSRAGCLEADFLTNFEVAQFFNEPKLSNDSAFLTTNPTDNLAFEAQLERLDALPEICTGDNLITEQTPTATFEHLWHTFNDHYAFFEKRGVDWDAQYDELRPIVNDAMSDSDLFDVIEALLEPLDDGHVSLEIDGDDFVVATRSFWRTSHCKLNMTIYRISLMSLAAATLTFEQVTSMVN